MYTAMSPNTFPYPVPRDIEGHTKLGIFDHAAAHGMEDLHFKVDPASGLKAIIAIHSTRKGSALGGTRCLKYPSEQHALEDAMRLAKGMSYKSAYAGLPYGGGKAVLLRPDKIVDPDAYFECYGEFINSLNGRFITAVDVGTKVSDMDIIVRKTQFVLSTSADSGDPSLHTALGVLNAIKAAVKVKLDRSDLEGTLVAIQGIGKVGLHLARLLHENGAKLVISDINQLAVQRCADDLGAIAIDSAKIIDFECDVLSPCALGSIINDNTVQRIKAKIICGAANNQLAEDEHGDILNQKKIFYVPDYVVNAGGLIHVIYGTSIETDKRIDAIYDSVCHIYQQSLTDKQPCHRVANKIAEQILSGSRQVVAHM